MGWKGALRSINAASRRASRESARRHKQWEREQIQHAKLLQREQDADEVAEFENYLEVLRSIHRDCGDPVDWRALHARPEPSTPERSSEREERAAHALATYTPGFFTRLLGQAERRRSELTAAVVAAKADDDAAYANTVRIHYEEHRAWLEMRELAGRILSGDREAELEAIEHLDPFSEMSDLGSEISFEVPESGPIRADILVNGEDVIPSRTKSLLQSGKLSVKKMPVGQFYDIYQDYVCGCVLRIARELFAILPIEAVIVTAKGEVLNTVSGHIEVQPILSVAIPRATLVRLNFDAVDPSDAMRNFTHRMDFKKTKGFLPVRPIESGELTTV